MLFSTVVTKCLRDEPFLLSGSVRVILVALHFFEFVNMSLLILTLIGVQIQNILYALWTILRWVSYLHSVLGVLFFSLGIRFTGAFWNISGGKMWPKSLLSFLDCHTIKKYSQAFCEVVNFPEPRSSPKTCGITHSQSRKFLWRLSNLKVLSTIKPFFS